MSSSTGVNLVRFFFYRGMTISAERQQKLVGLAYATAQSQGIAPTAILIRADIHDTTVVNGKRIKDPKGFHGTFAYKTEQQTGDETHVTGHGYTTGKDNFILREAVHTSEKKDDTLRNADKVVWPPEKQLRKYKDSPIGYSHVNQFNPVVSASHDEDIE
ncbi:hypothetical protein DM02DRAFT_542361 [Periconia macrospinosa]|uniref:Uncharacterized protein n=1 Tax=Periconia macrospinosa TaxID=97972 RepID=A0A2V1D4S3_9PLEO|nr:hypothetical protein DM02DRAFT_542361 [Periconia macrospinosa]